MEMWMCRMAVPSLFCVHKTRLPRWISLARSWKFQCHRTARASDIKGALRFCVMAELNYGTSPCHPIADVASACAKTGRKPWWRKAMRFGRNVANTEKTWVAMMQNVICLFCKFYYGLIRDPFRFVSICFHAMPDLQFLKILPIQSMFVFWIDDKSRAHEYAKHISNTTDKCIPHRSVV